MYPTRIDLELSVREKLVAILNDRLADAIHLSLQTKQAHWNVKGPQFIALHELFDSLYGLIAEQVDDIAERITALGGIAEGTLPAVTQRSSLPPYPLTIVNGREHLEMMSNSLATYGKLVRADIDHTDELGDADTADLFTGISRTVDKQLWFLEAHLQGDDSI